MRVAIYARYSSDKQSDASIDDQVRQCKARIDSEGWHLAKTYSDHGISGATLLRPGYQQLLSDARDGKIDVVIAEALDRLSRDQEDIAALYKQLSFAGVRLLTLAEGDITELHVGLKGTMNALFLKDLAQKTRRGLEGRVRQGRSGGGRCYGYDVVKELDANGEPVHGGRSINDHEARFINRIFTQFVGGQSPRAIAKQLNREGIPGPRGKYWRDTAIRGHHQRGTGILRNQLYVGHLVWNRQHYVKDPQTGKRLARPNPSSEWVTHDVPHLRIIDDSLWQQAQERLQAIRQSPAVDKARKTRFWEQRRPQHLLTGLAYCGVCNNRIVSVGRDYLACGHARRLGTCSNRKSIRRPQLEAMILDSLKDRLMQPDHVQAFITGYHQEINQLNREREQGADLTVRELSTTKRKLSGLIDAIADGLRSDGLQHKLEQLEARKRELEVKLRAAPDPAPRLHPNLAALYRQKVADLHEALNDPTIRQEAIELLRSLIDRVVLQPDDDGYVIILEGDIAAMVTTAQTDQTNKKAAIPEDAACSMKVVAGVGFEPTTFRL